MRSLGNLFNQSLQHHDWNKYEQKYFQFMLRQRGRVLEALYLLRHLDAMGLQELLQTNSAFHPCKMKYEPNSFMFGYLSNARGFLLPLSC